MDLSKLKNKKEICNIKILKLLHVSKSRNTIMTFNKLENMFAKIYKDKSLISLKYKELI